MTEPSRSSSAKDIRLRTKKRKRESYRITRAGNREEFERARYLREKTARREKIAKWIKDGARDRRHSEKKCKGCNKLCVKEERLGYELKVGETFTRARLMENGTMIYWRRSCNTCLRIWTQTRYRTSEVAFNAHQAQTLKSHRNGTEKERRAMILKLREASNGICAACGITLVQRGVAGWKQESVNDINPRTRKLEEETPWSDLAMACNACQFAQNNYNWDEFQDMLHTIARGAPERTNQGALTAKDRKYLRYGDMKCSLDIKLGCIEKNGRYCVLSGMEVVFEANKWNSISFDRDDSKLDYSVEQTSVTCKHINFVKKGAVTREQTLEWIAHIRANKDNLFPPRTIVQEME